MNGHADHPEGPPTAGAGQFAAELRALCFGDPHPDHAEDLTYRLLRIAEHLEAHERSLFSQREALRDQLLAVRAEIARERILLQEAHALRLRSLEPRGQPKAEPSVAKASLPSARKQRSAERTETRRSKPLGRGQKHTRRPNKTPPLRPSTALPEEKAAPKVVAPPTAPPLPVPLPPLTSEAKPRAETPIRESVANPCDEIVVPVRLGNAVFVGFFATVAIVLFVWSSLDRWSSHRSTWAVARVLEMPSATDEAVKDALAAWRESSFGGWDGSGAYVTARALARLVRFPPGDSAARPIAKIPSELTDHLNRAAERAAANIWIRLSQARLAEFSADKESSASLWRSLTAAPIVDPGFREAVADHWNRVGERDWAMAAYGAVMEQRPERTGPILTRLAAAGMKRKEYLALVPKGPRAILEATRYLKDSGHSDWWTYPKKALGHVAGTIGEQPRSELEAAVELAEIVGQEESAIPILAEAVKRCPQRHDWRLALARLHFESRNYEQSGLMARAVLDGEAARGDKTEEAAEAAAARALLEQIEVASSGSRRRPAAN